MQHWREVLKFFHTSTSVSHHLWNQRSHVNCPLEASATTDMSLSTEFSLPSFQGREVLPVENWSAWTSYSPNSQKQPSQPMQSQNTVTGSRAFSKIDTKLSSGTYSLSGVQHFPSTHHGLLGRHTQVKTAFVTITLEDFNNLFWSICLPKTLQFHSSIYTQEKQGLIFFERLVEECL